MSTYRIVFEDAGWRKLLPLVYWRSIGELRCGRRLLIEQHLDGQPLALWVRPQLARLTAERFPAVAVNQPIPPEARTVLLINARWLADTLPTTDGDEPAGVGICQGQIAWLRLPMARKQAAALDPQHLLAADGLDVAAWTRKTGRSAPADGVMVNYPWDLVHNNVRRMLADWKLVSPRIEGEVYPGVYLLDEKNIHIGPDSTIKPCTVLDAEEGPIWIGSHVRIAPHCTIQGPVVIGDGSLVQPGAVLREGTTIGPVCKVGGEIEGSILWGYSNKQHDGFLGHACLGAWINIAADSVNSDLKNTYGPIRVPINGVEVDSGRMFVGLTMGDHSKSSINSSFATGTVVGFCSNVICSMYPPKFVPSFCWMTDSARKPYEPDKGLAVAKIVMGRRKLAMTGAEEELFLSIATTCRKIEADPAGDL